MNDPDKTREQLIEELGRLRTTVEILRESEQRYKAIFESAREGILAADIETKRLRYANPAICRMFGFTDEEMQKMSVNDVHPKESLPHVLAEFEAQARGEKTLAPNIPCLRKDGTIFYADINTTNVIIDKRPCNVGFFTDVTRHKLDEEALRQSEQRFKSVVENIAVGVVLISPQMEIISINNRIKQQYPDIDVLTRPICYKTFNSPPREAVCSYCPVVKTLADDQIHEAITSTRQSGKVINSRIISSPIKDADGRITAAIEVVEDITERKNAEEAMRQSEEKFRNLAERSFDIIFTIDTDGFIKYVSPACERIFGYKPEEMTGKHFRNFVADSYMQPAAEYFSGTLKGCKLAPFSFEAERKDGHRVFIEANMSPVVQDDAIRGVQGVARDITYRRKTQEELQKAHDQLESRVQQRTAELAGAVEKLQNEIAERKRAEESLRKAEERFRTIFENAVVGIYRTTPDGRIMMANPSLVELLGYNSFDELSRLNLEKEGIDPSTPRLRFKQRMERDGSVSGLESIWIRRDGSRLYVLENAFAVRDNDGNIIYYEGTAQDITKRKEAEEKLMLYQEQLRSLASQLSLAEERLRRKIATDLHDNVSQNLAISKMKLDALAQSANPDQAKHLKEVTDLIGQTIEVSRSLTFEMSPPVLYELGFEAALGWLANQTGQRFGIEAEFVDDGKSKPLDTDVSVLLFQAVKELVNNVVKHAKARNLKIRTCKVRGNICVTVEDDGVGFDMARVVSARKNSTKTDVSDYSPCGFGLFNIRERLNHIGGSIEIHSKSGQGTLITLIAPLLKTRKAGTKTKRKMK